MKLLLIVVVLVGVSSSCKAYITPDATDIALIPLQKQLDLFANARKVIEKLVETLRKTAQDAMDAVNRFTANVQQQALAVRDRIISDVTRIRTKVTETLENIRKRLTDSGAGVRDCVQSRETEATIIFNEALNKTLICANERISEIGPQINELREIGQDGLDYANKTLADMRECTQGTDGLLAAGSCLGSITLQAEMKTLSLATRATLTMGRISLSMATLPASLEVCAGSRMVEAGLQTSRILLEVGTCSAATVYTLMTSNAEFQTDW